MTHFWANSVIIFKLILKVFNKNLKYFKKILKSFNIILKDFNFNLKVFNKEVEMLQLDYNTAIEMEQNDYIFYYDRAEAYFMLDKFTEAIDDITKAIDLVTGEVAAYLYYLRSLSFWGLKLYDKAIDDIKKSYEIYFPNNEIDYKNDNIFIDILKEKENTDSKISYFPQYKKLWNK